MSEVARDLQLAKIALRLQISLSDAAAFLGDSSCQACGAIGRVVIDHDHASGLVRGRLCAGCNRALTESVEAGALRVRAMRLGEVGARLEKLAVYLDTAAFQPRRHRYDLPRRVVPIRDSVRIDSIGSTEPTLYVQRWREQAGLSQDEFARTLGVHLKTVRRWEDGSTEPPAFLSFALNYLSEHPEVERDEVAAQEQLERTS